MVNLDLFKDEGEPREFKAGETIFHEGAEGKVMYVVLSGSVKLSVMGRQLEKVGLGSVFGEMALIDASPRSASAIAVSDCKLAAVSGSRFRELIRQDPQFALEIMGIMAARLRSMDRRL
jgi:CRP/FNR family transcriptional regulator, cyclic AMP receptor protein